MDFKLADILENLTGTLDHKAGEKGLELVVDVPAEVRGYAVMEYATLKHPAGRLLPSVHDALP